MSHSARSRLEELLDREIEAARGLAAVLTAERTALTSNSPQAVEQRAAEKIQFLATIEKLEQDRRAVMAGPEATGLAAAVAERWRALMELIAGCRTANEVNGHIIHVRQHQVRQLIDIVRGGVPITYSSQGRTSAKALRALARA
jgi:flagellar biosynthesis/type III secretory pathway chaperone